MTSQECYYINRVAETARERWESSLDSEQSQSELFLLNIEEIKSVISFYGGKLKINNAIESSKVSLNENNEFVIYYNSNGGRDVLTLLHELGHAFFHLRKIGDTESCLGQGYKEEVAQYFARAFAMPRSLFEKAIIMSSHDGMCDISKIANLFGVDDIQVAQRGRELKIWE